jgi:FMN phosphatase YigB (HAD superfamily)
MELPMKYFLDFDRTLFDTDAFNASLPEEPGCALFADELRSVLAQKRDQTLTGGTERILAWQKVTDALRSGALSFPPGALEKYLYTDAAEALRRLGNAAVIVTFGEPDRQKAKVESALARVAPVTAVYTGTASKAEFLSTWAEYHGEEAVFVDDRVHELAALSAAFPSMRLYEIRRDGAEGDGRWPVITSIAELP